MIISCAALMFSFGITASASTKDIPVELNKNYDACAFTITTENYGYYDVVVKSPKGEEHFGTIEGTNTTEVLVKDVKSGNWTITVSDHVDEIQATELTSEETASDNTDKEIGKVKVAVRAIDVSSYTIDDDIKVAKDIVGLKMYFKDDSFEIEWSDSSAGNVTVSVTDTQSNVELGKENVKGNSFECAIPSSTKQITVKVVPSTSTYIEGAANQYTLDVNNHPNATVTYEDKEYVNTATIPVTVTMNDTYGVQFVVNGAVVQEVPLQSAGEYVYNVPVEENGNEILTYIVDKDGNMRSTAHSVIRDSVPPVLTLKAEYNGAKTYESIVKFGGSVKDFTSFTINDAEVKVSGDGEFTSEYELHDGENNIVFKAVDIAGNETVYNAVVTKLIKEKKPVPWIPIIIGIVVVIGAIGFFIYKRNDPGNGKYNNMIDGVEEKKEKKKTVKPVNKKVLSSVQKIGIEVIVVAIISMLMFKFVLIPGIVPSSSMEPTLKVGDWGFANGLAYMFHEPERGDIVIVDSKELNEIIVKRVIGLPGDTVSFYDGYVYINDGLVYEDYIGADVETNSAVSDFIVPDGCYFILGDNRADSYDSRYWNNPYVTKSEIKGKYLVALFNLSKDKAE